MTELDYQVNCLPGIFITRFSVSFRNDYQYLIAITTMLNQSILQDLSIDNPQMLSFCSSIIQDVNIENSVERTSWRTSLVHPLLVRDLFLVDSLLEAICFLHCNQQFIIRSDQIILELVVVPVRIEQLQSILRFYPNARVHTIFPADLIGIIMDCKIVLCLSNIDGRFFFLDDQVEFVCRESSYKFNANDFSLKHFNSRLRLRGIVQAHKPKGGNNSFYQMVRKREI